MPAATRPPPKILFRADGNAHNGSGHLRRCLTLAAALRDRGSICSFICRAAPFNFNHLVIDAGFPLLELPGTETFDQQVDIAQVLALVQGEALFDVIVVDHYEISDCWESVARHIGHRIVAIDDLFDRTHDCDVLIDVAPGDATRYADRVPDDCVTLLGPRYAMLRAEFRQFRAAQPRSTCAIARVMISFGGVDAENLTGIAVKAIRNVLPDAAIDAVFTTVSAHRSALEQLAAKDPRLSVHVDADNMAELMQSSDIAIGAGGSTSWERACVGLPSVVIKTAENQGQTVNALVDMGCAIAVSRGPRFSQELGDIVTVLSATPALRRMMSRSGLSVVDGRGVDRVANAILPPMLVLRVAEENDARTIWQWRNAPQVRATAMNAAEIPWDGHLQWFTERIANPKNVILIGEQDGTGIGVVRFDLDNECAYVSIFLAPDTAGQGFGRALLRAGELWMTKHHPEIQRFQATVRPENIESIALFRGENYSARAISFERDLTRES
jgi:UDP-2,4-diacetamido-2,4,6-trideoxy-beta-L-altropyranose hydrolase